MSEYIALIIPKKRRPYASSVVFADEFAGGLLRKEPAKEADAVGHMRGKDAAESHDPHRRIERKRSEQDKENVREHRHRDDPLPDAEELHRHNVRLRDRNENRPDEKIRDKERRNEIRKPKRVGRIALAEIAAVERVATELPQMSPEKRTAVVAHDDPRVIDYALAGVDYVLAEKRVLARPEVGAVAAEGIKERFPDEEVAARVVVDVSPDAARLVAVAVVARDEQIVVYAPAHAREERIARRRHTRPADGADRLVSEIANCVFKPVRVGIGVVVDERDDLALRRLDAEISLLRRPHLAGRENGELNVLWQGFGGI